jgi:hypothetical protein
MKNYRGCALLTCAIECPDFDGSEKMFRLLGFSTGHDSRLISLFIFTPLTGGGSDMCAVR